jgi:hypothetical protein
MWWWSERGGGGKVRRVRLWCSELVEVTFVSYRWYTANLQSILTHWRPPHRQPSATLFMSFKAI